MIRDNYLMKPRYPAASLTTHDKRRALNLSPHYTDSRFDAERTVFGQEPFNRTGHAGLHYDYSDRLAQNDYTKNNASWTKAQEAGAPKNSAAFLEVYLTAYHNKPVEVVHVVAGVNRSSGYPYWVVGWRNAPRSTTGHKRMNRSARKLVTARRMTRKRGAGQ